MNAIEAVSGAARREARIIGRTTLLDGTSAEVAIEDTGPGIPADTAPHIFEPFFTTKDAGMGMGLSIVRTIVVRHGGRISAENRAEGGAVFRFTIPIARTRREEVSTAGSKVEATFPSPQANGAIASQRGTMPSDRRGFDTL
jgi:signal transduction histidine kinase